MSHEPTIRPMQADDVERAADVLVGGGWGDRRTFFRFAIDQPALTPLIAEADDRIAGTGVATVNGPAGWVGMIFVDEALRGRGIGSALTNAVLGVLESAGCASFALIATALGRPIYERLGFKAELEYVQLATDGLGHPDSPAMSPPSEPVRIRRFDQTDLAAVLALDAVATGENRARLLLAVVDPASTVVAVGPSGSVVGFDARAPWGTHPTIAPELVDGIRLVEARRAVASSGRDVRIGVPDANRPGLTMLVNLGWREERRLVRMVRGAPIHWDPRAIWGQFNYAIG